VVELLDNVILKVFYNKSALLKTKDKYYKFALLYLKKLKSSFFVSELLLDEDFQKRKLIYTIKLMNYVEFIKDDRVEDTIDALWKGSYICSNSIFSFFSISQNIFQRRLN